MTESNTTAAVLGTGIMAAAMVHNLLAASMEVRIWNRTGEKVEPLTNRQREGGGQSCRGRRRS